MESKDTNKQDNKERGAERDTPLEPTAQLLSTTGQGDDDRTLASETDFFWRSGSKGVPLRMGISKAQKKYGQ